MRKTISFRGISRDEFNAYFQLDSPGYLLAKDAIRAGELGSAVDTVETICLGNKLYEMELRNRIAEELKPRGKTVQYLENCGTQEGVDIAVQTLGATRMAQLIEEVMAEIRQQWQADLSRASR